MRAGGAPRPRCGPPRTRPRPDKARVLRALSSPPSRSPRSLPGRQCRSASHRLRRARSSRPRLGRYPPPSRRRHRFGPSSRPQRGPSTRVSRGRVSRRLTGGHRHPGRAPNRSSRPTPARNPGCRRMRASRVCPGLGCRCGVEARRWCRDRSRVRRRRDGSLGLLGDRRMRGMWLRRCRTCSVVSAVAGRSPVAGFRSALVTRRGVIRDQRPER